MPSFLGLHKPNPIEINNPNRLSCFIKTMPRLEDLSLTQVLNSDVTCRVCRGQRMIATRNRYTHKMYFSHCLHCNGSGRMSNRES